MTIAPLAVATHGGDSAAAAPLGPGVAVETLPNKRVTGSTRNGTSPTSTPRISTADVKPTSGSPARGAATVGDRTGSALADEIFSSPLGGGGVDDMTSPFHTRAARGQAYPAARISGTLAG